MTVNLPKLLKTDANFCYTALWLTGFAPLLAEYEDGNLYVLTCTRLDDDGLPERMTAQVIVQGEAREMAQQIVESLFCKVWATFQEKRYVGYGCPHHGHPEKVLEIRRAEQWRIERMRGRIVTGHDPLNYRMPQPGPLPESLRIKP